MKNSVSRLGWPLVALGVLAIVCFTCFLSKDRARAAPLTLGVDAGCEGCGPACQAVGDGWHLYNASRVGSHCSCWCCDETYSHSRFLTVPWRGAQPTASPTATRRPVLPPPPEFPQEETPASTATPDVPPLPGTPSTPMPTSRATATATPAATPAVQSTPPASRPTRRATSTARPTAEVVQPQETTVPARKRLDCIPKHAARPIALCATGSGSGWWLYFIGPGGRVMSGPHVPYPSPALAGRQVVLRHYISGEPIWLVWSSGRLQVRTVYAGKPYHFSVGADGVVRHIAW